MDYDMKWFVLVILVFMGFPMIGLGLDHYQKHQCRMEAIRANMPVEQIERLCK